MSDTNSTKYDRLVERAKNNPVISVLLFIGLAISIVLTFVSSLRTALSDFLPKESSSVARQVPTLRDESQSSDRAAIAQIAADSASFSPVTFDEYVENAMSYLRHDQTELQRKEYVAALDGKRVVWEGYVNTVNDDGPFSVGATTVSIAHQTGSLAQSRFAVFHFAAADKQAVLALKGGDRVQITGVIDEWDVEVVHLTGSKLLKVGGNFFEELEAQRRKSKKPGA